MMFFMTGNKDWRKRSNLSLTFKVYLGEEEEEEEDVYEVEAQYINVF